MELSAEATKTLINNIKQYQSLNPANDEEFKVMMRHLRALSMMLDDLLLSEGEREPLTAMEKQERKVNTCYETLILPSEGRKPKFSGKKG
jgi:hypothetical protein